MAEVIYFAQPEPGGPIKVGYSRDSASVYYRLDSLEAGCPWPLRLLHTLEGDVDAERGFHKRFDALRIHREWFEAKDPLAAFLRGEGCEPGPPAPFGLPYKGATFGVRSLDEWRKSKVRAA